MKTFPVAAALAILSIAAPSRAHEIILDLPDFQLTGGSSVVFEFPVVDDEAEAITQLYFTGMFENLGEDGSWASDLQLDLTAPDGQQLLIGGFDNVAGADLLWDFQGEGSEPAGEYASIMNEPFPVSPVPSGLWRLELTLDRLDAVGHAWTGTQLWLIPATPGPGGLALLALAGAVGGRRRR